MINTIRTVNIYNTLSTISEITSLCTVLNQKPHEKATPDTRYIYLTKISDTPITPSFSGHLQKRARVQITIVSQDSFTGSETPESVLFDVIDAINNAIVSQDCLPVSDWDGFIVSDIVENTESPIFYGLKNRPYINKDYIFTYGTK